MEVDPLEPLQLTQLTAVEANKYPSPIWSSRSDEAVRYYAITPPTDLVSFKLPEDRPPVWMALDQIQDPQNMGSLIRFLPNPNPNPLFTHNA